MVAKPLPVYAILLAGGVGSRLWPVSRELYPKQLVKLIGNDSLVQATVKRLLPLLAGENIRIVCGNEHRHEIARHLNAIGVRPEGNIIGEPCGRNTAPAILLGVMHILQTVSDAVLCVFPADHVIKDTAAFHQKLRAAVELAQNGHVVTFGITPHYPETGYGYIEGAAPVSHGALAIRRFVEKPDLQTAQGYLDAGRFFWNSGMFAFRASVISEEFQRYQPKLFNAMQKLDLSLEAVSETEYARLADISIDYAIMEKTRKAVVLPSDIGWSDIGSWKSLYEFLPKDPDNNVIEGDVLLNATHNSIIMGYERLIAVNHVDHLAIVETPDSIFVSNIENSRDVKTIVARLKAKGRQEYRHHRTIAFAWGTSTLLEKKPDYRVLRLVVYPGMRYESEPTAAAGIHASLLRGEAHTRIQGKRRTMSAGQSIEAAAGVSIQIDNPGDTDLWLVWVETQT